MKCGECLMNQTRLVDLGSDGICPKCGADYSGEDFAPAQAARLRATTRRHQPTTAELATNSEGIIMRERITQAVARTLTLDAVASAWEENQQLEEGSDLATIFPEDWEGAGSGEDWDDVVREGAPLEAVDKAREIVRDFETRNGRDVVDLGEEWDTAAHDDGNGFNAAEYEWSDDGPERFGHCLALQSLGHGVGLDDDIPHGATYRRPDTGLFEFYAWDFDVLDFLGRD